MAGEGDDSEHGRGSHAARAHGQRGQGFPRSRTIRPLPIPIEAPSTPGERAPATGLTPRRQRVRELGLAIGHHKTGRYNAITDVKGVLVGHSTIIRGEGKLRVGKGPVRTGVTAILPRPGGATFEDRVIAGSFILNGAGEMTGLTQVMEWGLIETPILITNTLSVGTCAEAVVQYMVERHPGIGLKHDVVIPLVGECDDSWLNDIAGRHVRVDHVYEAIETAKSGPVPEGNVGGGTGFITCDFKGGVGTSSRKLADQDGGFTAGVLVASNFGHMRDLRMGGIPVGEELAPRYANTRKRDRAWGSIIAVVATDAPLLTHQLTRIGKRVALGIGRAGSIATHGSGEIILAFSTANAIPRAESRTVTRIKMLVDEKLDPLYEAVIEATEEAILNAICAATDMEGVNRNFAPALPLDAVREILARHLALRPKRVTRRKRKQ